MQCLVAFSTQFASKACFSPPTSNTFPNNIVTDTDTSRQSYHANLNYSSPVSHQKSLLPPSALGNMCRRFSRFHHHGWLCFSFMLLLALKIQPLMCFSFKAYLPSNHSCSASCFCLRMEFSSQNAAYQKAARSSYKQDKKV